MEKNILTLVNPGSQGKKQVVLNEDINDKAESIAFGERIFVMGDFECTKKVYEIDIEQKELLQKAKMLNGKYYHSLCKTNTEIYSIGGINNMTGWEQTKCEKYSVKENKWLLLPKLQTPRHHCAVCV